MNHQFTFFALTLALALLLTYNSTSTMPAHQTQGPRALPTSTSKVSNMTKYEATSNITKSTQTPTSQTSDKLISQALSLLAYSLLFYFTFNHMNTIARQSINLIFSCGARMTNYSYFYTAVLFHKELCLASAIWSHFNQINWIFSLLALVAFVAMISSIVTGTVMISLSWRKNGVSAVEKQMIKAYFALICIRFIQLQEALVISLACPVIMELLDLKRQSNERIVKRLAIIFISNYNILGFIFGQHFAASYPLLIIGIIFHFFPNFISKIVPWIIRSAFGKAIRRLLGKYRMRSSPKKTLRSVVNKMKNKKEDGSVTCMVCLMEMSLDDTFEEMCELSWADDSMIIRTPCCHFYHADCLRRWCKVNKKCPMDNRQLKVHLI